MSSQREPLHLFEGYGIELEYMIVNRKDLRVMPIADQALAAIAGEPCTEVERGTLGWSNELVLHVLEMKCNGPQADLEILADSMYREATYVNEVLAGFDAMLLPTAMHPLFNPLTETRIWPHENTEIYQSYHRIFSCTGHGWSNLQSTHINLPFHGDEEFGRLHAAIRLVLPLLPALAASSPIVEGKLTGLADNRLNFYRHNQIKVPSIAGSVVPEPVFSIAGYREEILERVFRDIAPHDPQCLLRHEWLNSRGAIARFDRNAIEIRVLDIQECVHADLAVVALVSGLVRALVEERWSSLGQQQAFPTEGLASDFIAGIGGGDAVLKSRSYLSALGLETQEITGRQAWQTIASNLAHAGYLPPGLRSIAFKLVESGNLAERIAQRWRKVGCALPALSDIYRELAGCLAENRLFIP